MGDDINISLDDILHEEEYHQRVNDAHDELERDWDERYEPDYVDDEYDYEQD